MKTMHLFRISYQDLGEEIKLIPEVPHNRAHGENNTIKRICAAPTIYQCIQSKAAFANEDLWNEGTRTIYIYECNVPVKDLIQPTIEQVSDIWFTGEMWVMRPHVWHKVGEYILELGKRIRATDYKWRYHLHPKDKPSIKNDGYDFGFDGDPNNFRFIETGPDKYYKQFPAACK